MVRANEEIEKPQTPTRKTFVGRWQKESERDNKDQPREFIQMHFIRRFEETDEGDASEATRATTEEHNQLSVTPKRNCRSPSAEVLIPRKEGPQNEGSQPPSTPGYSEDSSTLIEPPVSLGRPDFGLLSL